MSLVLCWKSVDRNEFMSNNESVVKFESMSRTIPSEVLD